VCWDPSAAAGGCIYAGGEDGQLYRVDPSTGASSLVARTAGGMVLGIAADGRGRVLMCAPGVGAVCVWDPSRGETSAEPCITAAEGAPLVQPNHAAFGPDGTLYFSDSGTWGADDGRLLAVHGDGVARLFSREPACFTNGLAIGGDGRLWCVESREPVLSAFDLRGPTVRRERIHRFDGCVLDGLAATADGGLLISCYRPDRIYHRAVDGHLETLAEDAQGTLLAAPTNIAFVGPRLERLVVANLGRWHLAVLDPGLHGAPLYRPARWGIDADGFVWPAVARTID
jgi:gluconolactonase